MNKIAVVCGSFHEKYVLQMLDFAKDQAAKEGLEISEIIWVPGAMEVP